MFGLPGLLGEKHESYHAELENLLSPVSCSGGNR